MYELKVEGAFEAAHQIKDYPGKCARLHGHNWVVQAVVRGRSLLASLNEALSVHAGFDLGQWLPDAVTQGLVLGIGPLESTP